MHGGGRRSVGLLYSRGGQHVTRGIGEDTRACVGCLSRLPLDFPPYVLAGVFLFAVPRSIGLGPRTHRRRGARSGLWWAIASAAAPSLVAGLSLSWEAYSWRGMSGDTQRERTLLLIPPPATHGKFRAGS